MPASSDKLSALGNHAYPDPASAPRFADLRAVSSMGCFLCHGRDWPRCPSQVSGRLGGELPRCVRRRGLHRGSCSDIDPPSVPWPCAVDLDVEGEAQDDSDEDDDSEHYDALEGLVDDHGADDVGDVSTSRPSRMHRPKVRRSWS